MKSNYMRTQYTKEDILSDPIFKRFLNKKTGKSKNTIKNYTFSIKKFCNFVGKSPTEIYELHKSDLDNHVPEYQQWLAEALEDFVADEIKNENRHGGIKRRVMDVRAFFHTFRLKPTPEIEIGIKNVREDIKYRLTVEDIRKAIKHSKPTYQTYIIVQAQTGLTLVDVLSLNIGDFKNAVTKKGEKLTLYEAITRVKNDKNVIGCFDMRRKKTIINEFYTFIGYEGLSSIAELIEDREPEYLVDEAPIFLKEYSRLPKNIKQLAKTNPEYMRLTVQAVESYVDRMHNVIRTKDGRKGRGIFKRITVAGQESSYFRTHKIRAWYADQLRFKAGFSSEDTKYLMGQTTGDVLERYIDTNNYKALKANYRKALPYLAINEEVILEENKEAIDSLTTELQEERRKRETMEKKILNQDEQNKIFMNVLETLSKADAEGNKAVELQKQYRELRKLSEDILNKN